MAITREKGAGIIVSHDVRDAVVVRPQNALPDIVNKLQKYDTVGGTFTDLSPMNKCRAGFSLHSYSNSLVAIGGTDGSIIHSYPEIYDIINNTWTLKSPMSIPRCYFQAAISSSTIYIAGGLISSGLGELSISNVLEKYNILTDTWETLEPIPDTYEVAFGVAHILFDDLYILCGHRGRIGTPNNVILRYDITGDTWITTEITNISQKRMYQRTLPFVFSGPDDTVYCVNGLYEDTNFAQGETKFQRSGAVKIYLPTATVSSGDEYFSTLPKARYAGASAEDNTSKYFLGGTNTTGNTLRTLEKYT